MSRQMNTNKIWRYLTNAWAILTALFFLLDFFHFADLDQALGSVAVIYISLLSLYTALKEYSRWHEPKFVSRFHGEAYVAAWTLIMIIFVIGAALYPDFFHVPGEYTATYLSIMGIFALSTQSKKLKNK